MKHPNSTSDQALHYRLHRAALNPVLAGPSSERHPEFPDAVSVDSFADFLCTQHLHGLWLNALEGNDLDARHEALRSLLAPRVRQDEALTLPHQRLLSDASVALDAADIPWFITKGAQFRHTLYDSPWLRPNADTDLFVHADEQNRVIAILREAAFQPVASAENLSHEITLFKHGGALDLHWQLFRPGRLRPGVMDWLFSRRERFGEFWGLDDTASLFVMLVHPAITKYLLSPTSMLIHQVDQARLIGRGRVDWKELKSMLERSGTRTAAWASLYVLRTLAGVRAPEDFEGALRPGRIRRGYLRQWIDRAWITRWFERRWLVAGLFSLALQDTASDAVRALRALRRERGSAPPRMGENQAT